MSTFLTLVFYKKKLGVLIIYLFGFKLVVTRLVPNIEVRNIEKYVKTLLKEQSDYT